MRKDGKDLALFEGTKIRIDFDHGRNRDGVGWRADCNYFGALVEVTADRLIIAQIVGTEMGCGKLQAQDSWLPRFFRADPKWRIPREDRLKLTAGDRVIRLRRRAPSD